MLSSGTNLPAYSEFSDRFVIFLIGAMAETTAVHAKTDAACALIRLDDDSYRLAGIPLEAVGFSRDRKSVV